MSDEKYMSRCLELAATAEGRTRPNPMVGCVIVSNDAIVAEGFHERAGQPHAEIVAFSKLENVPTDATLYVNLEPCSHFGRTPPCANAVIESGVKRVVVGTVDPNPNVSGAGIQLLKDAGIGVTVGVQVDACRKLNRGYFSTVERQRPWVVAKYAMTLDGKIASRGNDSKWISGESSRAFAHSLRNTLDAVMVGPRTLILDNPKLTCRMDGGRDPVTVAVDPMLGVPISHHIVRPKTVLFCREDAPAAKRTTLEDIGVVVVPIAGNDGEVPVSSVLTALSELEVTTLLVEGGGQLLGRLFDDQLVDEVFAFISPKIVGGRDAVSPIGGRGFATIADSAHLIDRRIEQFDDDICYSGTVGYACSPDS